MIAESFLPTVLFTIGPVQVTSTVLCTLIVSAILIAFAFLVRRLGELDHDVLEALEGKEGLSDSIQARLRKSVEAVRGSFVNRRNDESGADATPASGSQHHS